MKFKGTLLAVLPWLVAAITAPAGWAAPWLDTFASEQTGADGVAWTSAQLPDGRLLFGFNGVVEFDGVRWKTHPVNGALAVRAIAPAPDGRVWVGALNEIGFLRPNGSRYDYHSLRPELPAELRPALGDVWHVFAEGEGAVFVAQQDVVRWTGRTFRHWHLPGGRRLAAFREGGRIYVAHQPSGLYELGPDGPQPILSAAKLGAAGVLWRGAFAGRTVLVTTHGLLEERGGELEPFVPALDDWLRQNVLASVHRLRSGSLAIGTLHGGLRLLPSSAGGPQAHGVSTGLPTEAVYSLFEDAEGFLWVTSPAGLARLHPDERMGAHRLGEVVTPSASGLLGRSLVVGTSNGLFAIDPALARGKEPIEPLPLPDRHVYALESHEDGLVVAHRRGIDRLGPDRTLRTFHSSGADTLALAVGPDAALYAAEGRRLWRFEAGAEPVRLGDLREPPVSLAPLAGEGTVLGTASSGLAWVGASGRTPDLNAMAGIAGESGPTYVSRLPDDGLFVARGRCVALLRLDPSPVRFAQHVLPEGFRPTALHVAGAEAWLGGERVFASGGRRGLIYRFRTLGPAGSAEPWDHPILQRAGVIRSLLADANPAEPRLWVAGSAGIIQYPISAIGPATAPRPPLLRPVTPADLYSLPYDNHRLEIEIARPEASRGATLLVQTRLIGGHAGWDTPQDRTTLTLENLQHGGYELLARFVTPSGETSEVSRIAFRILPPWWLSRWALGAGAALLLILTWLAVHLRLARLRRRAAWLEKLVQERTAELTHANHAKTQFVARMSHELRNPLNGLVASAHALQERGLGDDQRDLIATMRHCAELLDRLIGDVLDFSEVESGRITLHPTLYDPVELAARAVTMVDPVARRKGLELELDVAANAPESLRGDPARVQQVVLNLLGNAIKFSDRGRVTVRLAAPPAPAEGLLLTVTDEGPGIPAGERNQLFEDFARTKEARERRIPGNGLGLAVSRQLVQAMGGRIWLDDTLPQGARFCVQLPLDLSSRAPTGAQPQVEPSRALFLPKSALVVEDLEYNARAMAALLARHGCRVRTAPDAATALRILRVERFEVVFIDLDLPDMSGTDLARRILEHRGPEGALLLIAATAYADEHVRRTCAAVGLHGFLSKPVTPEKLRQALAEANRASLSSPAMDLPESMARGGLDFRLLRVIAPEPEDLRRQAGRLHNLLQTDLRELVALVEQRDFAAVQTVAHRILSHARFIGATQLAALAEEVERGARSASVETLELVAALTMEVERVGRELSGLAR